MEEILKQIQDGAMFGTVGKVFDLVEIAEEEIELAVKAHPDRAEALRSSFGTTLYPGELTKFGKPIYRAHAKELLARIIARDESKEGTSAECLVALSLASLKAPLTNAHLAAMEKVFAVVFPQNNIGPNRGHEAWAGETEEILSELRRKIGAARR